MTKQEKETQARLLDLLQANTEAMGKMYHLLATFRAGFLHQSLPGDSPAHIGPPAEKETPPEAVAPAKESTEKKEETKTEITVEYCRKAMKAIGTKITKDECKAFLASFDGATTIPKLKKEHYEAFIAGATKIMKGE